MNGLSNILKTIGPVRLAAMGAVGLGVLIFLGILTSRFGSPDYALLYGDLEASDAAQIVAKLDSMGVPYELHGDGTQIMVPRSDVPNLRLAMAQDGLPEGGSVGYELFDQTENFGASNLVQDINRLRALEGELARTIRTIASVRNARVHLVLPRKEIFQRDREEPSASIALQLKGSASLTPGQVRAIRQLVAAAVPGLTVNRISIVDSRGELLARSADGSEGDEALATNASEVKQAYEARVARSIEELLAKSVGPGKVRVEVAADMDFDRVTERSETYDPNGQVVRSTQTVEEEATDRNQAAEGIVSVGQNLPDAQTQRDAGQDTNASRNARTEEIVNYEISRTVTDHVREAGSVRRLSVAVLLDGTYSAGPGGEQVYAPRSQEEIASIEALVRSAVGFDQSRGDTVEIINMQFARDPMSDRDLPAPGMFDDLSFGDFARIAELLLIGVFGLLALLLVVRPLLQGLSAGKAITGSAESAEPRQLVDQSAPQLALEAGEAPRGPGARLPSENEELEQMIGLKNVEGNIRAASLTKIGDIVNGSPEAAVSVLRNWINEGA